MSKVTLKKVERTINDRIAGIKMICLANTDLDLRAAAYHIIRNGQDILDACRRLERGVYQFEAQRDHDDFYADSITYKCFLDDSNDFVNGLY